MEDGGRRMAINHEGLFLINKFDPRVKRFLHNDNVRYYGYGLLATSWFMVPGSWLYFLLPTSSFQLPSSDF